jgi:hypothetical protein
VVEEPAEMLAQLQGLLDISLSVHGEPNARSGSGSRGAKNAANRELAS